MIRLRTLGALDLRGSEGQELRPVLAQPKRAALLAYLALASPRGPHRRDTLLALFWPEQDTEHARNALSQAVHFLRRSLGGEALVASNGDGLSLEWEDFWCDAVAFEEALDRGQPTEALDLYRGDLLEGFHVAEAPGFEQWLETERTRLGSRYAQTLETLAQEREAAGDQAGAVRLWRQLAARDLYNSRVALRLMRALATAGDPAGAIQHARVHETLLREELDLAPDREIAALVRQLQEAPSAEQRLPKRGGGGVSTEAPAAAEPEEIRATAAGSEIRAGQRGISRRRVAIMGAGVLALLAAGGAVALRNGAGEPPMPPVRSLAVLPLENLSTDPAQQSFADGMHDALISELARYPDLTVISRTSVIQYKGTRKRLPDIARELKVQGVVEGTVLRDGERVRINVQLLHGPSDRHLWAKSYERDLGQILVLQGELAEAIAREVRVVTSPVERSRRIAARVDSVPRELQLRELYLRGRHAEQNRSLTGVQTAKGYYSQSIERDSTFALGYAGLAGTYGFMASMGYAPARPALDSARMMARRAIVLDSSLSETRTALAVTLGDAGEFEAAEREFRRAIELAPSDARAHYWYSVLLVALGRGSEALREVEKAAELDPFTPRGVTSMRRYAQYLLTGELPHLKLAAGTRWSGVLKAEPGEPWARRANALDLALEGHCAEARREIIRAEQQAPDNLPMLAATALVDWYCDDKPGARALVERLKRRPDAREHGRWIAIPHVVFGEKDSAFVWLERNRWTVAQLTDLRAIRWLEPLRSDPRYPELLRRLGLCSVCGYSSSWSLQSGRVELYKSKSPKPPSRAELK